MLIRPRYHVKDDGVLFVSIRDNRVPMDRIVFISVPLKKSDVVDVSEPIEKFFATTLGTSFTDENRSAVEEFAKMRKSAVFRTLDRHESSLELLFK